MFFNLLWATIMMAGALRFGTQWSLEAVLFLAAMALVWYAWRDWMLSR